MSQCSELCDVSVSHMLVGNFNNRVKPAMESTTRTFAKAVSWQILGLFSMALIGYMFTGSLLTAGSLAAASAATGLVCYVLHERVWNRVGWGRNVSLESTSRR